MFTKVKTAGEIDSMRKGGRMLATVLQNLKETTKSGMNTKDLADRATKDLAKLGGKPAFLNYQGFPDVLCVSVNEEVVHGIPRRDKIIEDGDIVSVDFGVLYKGLITDAAVSFLIGDGNKDAIRLIKATEQSMYAAIDIVKDGIRTGDIGNAVENVLNQGNFGIVRDLVGHGVGHQLHEDPNIPNYGIKGTGDALNKGMTIAIEPMATLGTHQVYVADDNWTIITRDGSWAAHFEHTVLINQNGAEILTRLE